MATMLIAYHKNTNVYIYVQYILSKYYFTSDFYN